MTTDRDAIYDESTDEESEIPPNPSVLSPGKVNTFISFVEHLTWAYYLLLIMIINLKEKCYKNNFFYTHSLGFLV